MHAKKARDTEKTWEKVRYTDGQRGGKRERVLLRQKERGVDREIGHHREREIERERLRAED